MSGEILVPLVFQSREMLENHLIPGTFTVIPYVLLCLTARGKILEKLWPPVHFLKVLRKLIDL